MLATNVEKHEAKAGDYCEPDGWNIGQKLVADTDTYTDDGWPGCAFRLHCTNIKIDLGVNVVVTGMPHYCKYGASYKSRVRIEYVGDCEPSTFVGGWLYHD
jgi:hypothetical protein